MSFTCEYRLPFNQGVSQKCPSLDFCVCSETLLLLFLNKTECEWAQSTDCSNTVPPKPLKKKILGYTAHEVR